MKKPERPETEMLDIFGDLEPWMIGTWSDGESLNRMMSDERRALRKYKKELAAWKKATGYVEPPVVEQAYDDDIPF